MTDYVVITGASSGIGRALTVLFACKDYHVLAIGRNEIELQRTKNILDERQKKNISLMPLDLSFMEHLDKVPQFLKPTDRILFLVHCAAVTEPHVPVTTMSLADFDKAINVNAKAPLFLTQKLIPYFSIEKTRVLFIGSDYVGIKPKIRPHITACYAMSKAILDTAVPYARLEYNCALIGYFNPGTTKTKMYQGIKTAVLNRDRMFARPTLAQPDKVAQFICGILEHTSKEDFPKIDWDYRKKEHFDRINTTTTLRSRL